MTQASLDAREALPSSARQAIFAGPSWRGGRYPPSSPPEAGLAAALDVLVRAFRGESRARNAGA